MVLDGWKAGRSNGRRDGLQRKERHARLEIVKSNVEYKWTKVDFHNITEMDTATATN